MLRLFIQRPVLSTVISIIILILGVIGLSTLPIEQYPEVAPPTVQVSANYLGANAETVLNSVVTPLEEEINGAEGMTYMTSSSSNDGSANITVYFKLGTDPDIAAVNVQNRVSKATSNLPQEVIETGVTTEKSQTSALMFMSFYSENIDLDGIFVQNYVKINIVPKLQRIEGVGQVEVFGAKDYAMRIWLSPDKMASYGITPADVQAALNEQNLQAAPGKVGENSEGVFEYVLKYKGQFDEVSEYENIIIRADGNDFLRVKDIATVELGAFNYGTNNQAMGYPGVAIGIFQTSGSNAQQIILDIENVLDESAPDFPDGFNYIIPYNVKDFLDASMDHVVQTLIEAFILVFIVVFLFLQDLRSIIIPAIAVPVAIIGTFFFLEAFGFTINLLTLFALVLAIGIVVDDAIVVVEAVHAKMETTGKPAREATLDAMQEIFGAIISITLVMAAVFIPASFLKGPAGVFYKQFAITLAISILISAVNALTLSPALCAVFLKDLHKKKEKKNLLQRFFNLFNRGFDWCLNVYSKIVHLFIRRKIIPIAGLLGFIALMLFLFNKTPQGFIPTEDRGIVFADVTMPPGSTLYQTEKVVNQLDSIYQTMDIIDKRMSITGFSLLNGGNGSAYAFSVLKLQDFSKRKNDDESIDAVVGELFKRTFSVPNARILFFTPPSVQGFGNANGFELKLQNKTGTDDWHTVSNVANEFLFELNKRPEIQYAITAFDPNYPQYELEVNVDKIKNAGLNVNQIFATLQGYVGGLYVSNFNKFGKQYRVLLQAKANDRSKLESLNSIFVNNGQNAVPITEFINFKKVYGPETVQRFNLLNSVSVNGLPNPGYSSGDAVKVIAEVAKEHLPSTYAYDYSGITREEIATGNQSIIIFALSLLFVYFLLSAQYESYIVPLSVIFSLPIGVAGAIGFVNITGLENNIYFQIALIMLIGLLAKNAILIVEFAIQRRQHGMSIVEAAIEGAKVRLRPILMTSFAFIFGLFPLAFSTGVGAIGNQSIGKAAVGGMFIGTVFGVFVIPVLFVIFQSLQERISGKKGDSEINESKNLPES
ncbi:efflux RND transporter permease subunit [Aureivirga sp. CE67]|uniref:efflux RND transporter permease subunit n=1 Tax=Aureivirga sp. CE67 TaxID=1788983 RepID=UPI0018CB396C|nr:efflux RND transporter permease subunit [Aureivirga sp. CE67]